MAETSSTGPEPASTTSADAGSSAGPHTDDTGAEDTDVSVDSGTTSADAETTGGDDPACQGWREELEAVAMQYVEANALVGLSVAANQQGCAAWSSAWGVASLADDTALTPEHILRAGSVTKSFTAALVLKLAEDGLLSLDDALSDWEQDIPGADEITIRQLLNHTSGLADYQSNRAWQSAAMADVMQVWDPQALVDFAVELGPVGAPGSGHVYANTNYVLAGVVAELASGTSYGDALRSWVLEPAGLTHTYLDGFDRWSEPTATGYLVISDGEPFDSTPLYHPSTVWAAGAVVATADDLQRWLTQLLSSDFLSADSQTELVTFVPMPGGAGYGLGIYEAGADGVTAFGHNGAILGFQSAVMFDAATGTTVAVMHNQIQLVAGVPATDPTALALEMLATVAEQ